MRSNASRDEPIRGVTDGVDTVAVVGDAGEDTAPRQINLLGF